MTVALHLTRSKGWLHRSPAELRLGWTGRAWVALLVVWVALTPVNGARADGARSSVPTDAQPAVSSPSAPAPATDRGELVSRLVRSHFDPSYLAHPFGIGGLKSTLVEASLMPHFYVSQPGWRVAFVLTPKVVVRMYNETSAPAKTPSYMPRVSLYAWWLDRLQPGQYTAYASLTLSHHSNGQSDAFLLSDGAINHESGNFSTNYLELSGFLVGCDRQWFGWSRLSVIWHPGFNQEVGLRGRYGLVRTMLKTMLIETAKPLDSDLTIEIGAILDQMLLVSGTPFTRALERFPISVQYTVAIPGVDLGLYASYYLGHDYYNIWFDRWTHMIQLGISGRVGPIGPR